MSARLLLVVGLIAVPVAAAHSATIERHAVTAIMRSPASPDSAREQAMFAQADEATMAGRFLEARKLYRELIEEQRRADRFAGKALWRLALNYLYADDPRRAVATLDELITQSNRFGDPTTELRATLESAVLWQQLKRADLVVSRVSRVRELLQSPVIPDVEKSKVRSRMPEEVTVASR